METMRPKPVADVREFFAEELKKLLEKHRVLAKPDSFEYLVNLLISYMDSETFFAKSEDGSLKNNVLADMYANYLQGNPEEKRATLKRLGDICLLVTGLFPDSLNRKLIDIDYYFGMGGGAYWQLSKMQFTALASGLFKELSVKFKLFSEVLAELSDRSGLQSNTDLLRLYEKWLLTGNDHLKELLAENGIQTPVKLDVKIKH